MDRFKFTTIAHRDHVLANPVSEAKLDRVIGLLGLEPGQRVLDIGCGQGEVLIRIVEFHGVSAVGVDLNGDFLEEAQARAADRIPEANLLLQQADIADYPAEPDYDLVICIGGPLHVTDGGLATLMQHLKPGGQLLIGCGYWKKTPDPAYLGATGIPADEMLDHAGNVAAAVAAGLTPLYSVTASEDDWDDYEGLYLRSVERYCAEHPDDPDVPALQARIRPWRDAYYRWGRNTLGFGLYLLHKPAESTPARGFVEP